MNKLNFYQFLSIDGVKEGGAENLEGVQEDKVVKKFYKKWWFWVLVVIIVLILYLLSGFYQV